MILYTMKSQAELSELFTKGVFCSKPEQHAEYFEDYYKTYGYGWIKRKMGIDHYPVWFYCKYPQHYITESQTFVVTYDSAEQPLFVTKFGPWHELLVYHNLDKMRDLKRYDKMIVPQDKIAYYMRRKSRGDHELQVCLPLMHLNQVVAIKPYKRLLKGD